MNQLAPFGFADSHRLGAAVNYQMSRRWISPSNPTPIFSGDPVVQLSTGFIAQAAPGTTQIAGIFIGCERMNVSQRKITGSRFWPGQRAARHERVGKGHQHPLNRVPGPGQRPRHLRHDRPQRAIRHRRRQPGNPAFQRAARCRRTPRRRQRRPSRSASSISSPIRRAPTVRHHHPVQLGLRHVSTIRNFKSLTGI